MKDEAVVLGMTYGSATERLEQVAQTIRDVRELDGDRRTPIMMAIMAARRHGRWPPPRPMPSIWPSAR